MTIGIYKLIFKNTDMVYIGQSLSIESRYKQHLNKLYKGIAAIKLQQAYIAYGIPIYEILCECPAEELDSTEIEAIDIFNSVEKGFNTLNKTSSGQIITHQVGELNSRSKFSNEQITEVFMALCDTPELTQQEIADITGVTKGVVNSVSCGLAHKWLKGIYPDKYDYMLNLKGSRSSYSVKGNKVVHSNSFPNIKNPEGHIFTITNITRFCLEYGLHSPSVSKLLSGKLKSHKGWTSQLSELSSVSTNTNGRSI